MPANGKEKKEMRKDKLYKDPLRGKRKFLTIGSFVIFGVSAVVCNYLSFNMGRSNVMVDMINRVLEEVKYGKSTESSLLEMSKRIKSEGLSRAIHQIIGTLRVGGNLAGSLDIIAKDISFEMQIKLKEYSQKLNSFILIYTFIAILAPVISLIMLMASSTVMGDVISSNLLILIYSVFFPMIVMFMGVFIKKLEPKI